MRQSSVVRLELRNRGKLHVRVSDPHAEFIDLDVLLGRLLEDDRVPRGGVPRTVQGTTRRFHYSRTLLDQDGRELRSFHEASRRSSTDENAVTRVTFPVELTVEQDAALQAGTLDVRAFFAELLGRPVDPENK